jgi:hypothetical protein
MRAAKQQWKLFRNLLDSRQIHNIPLIINLVSDFLEDPGL